VKALLLSQLGKLLYRLLPLIVDRIVAYLKEEAEKRERQRRADDLNNSKDEDEFDDASRNLP